MITENVEKITIRIGHLKILVKMFGTHAKNYHKNNRYWELADRLWRKNQKELDEKVADLFYELDRQWHATGIKPEGYDEAAVDFNNLKPVL